MVGNLGKQLNCSSTLLPVFLCCSTHTGLYINIHFYMTFNQFQRHLYNQGRFVRPRIGTKIATSILKTMNHENSSILEILKDSLFTHTLKKKKNTRK